MKTEKVLMTPDRAAILLDGNISNRILRIKNIDFFASTIERGEWKLTHQGVAITKSGRVADGQHRLHAIVKTGIAVPVLLSTDCDEDIFHAIDCGLRRNNRDLTGITPRILEMLAMYGAFLMPVRKLLPGELVDVNEKIGWACNQLMEYAPTSRTGVTSAPTRAAAAFLIAEGKGQYAMDMYRRTSLLEMDGMPRVTQNFIKQALGGAKLGGSHARVVLFCKALKAFDEAEADSIQCMYSDSIRDKVKARVLDYFSD